MWIIESRDDDAVEPVTVGSREHLDGPVASADDVDAIAELGSSTHVAVRVDSC